MQALYAGFGRIVKGRVAHPARLQLLQAILRGEFQFIDLAELIDSVGHALAHAGISPAFCRS